MENEYKNVTKFREELKALYKKHKMAVIGNNGHALIIGLRGKKKGEHTASSTTRSCYLKVNGLYPL